MSARIDLPSGLVTFLFTDIEGSTRLAQRLGAGYRPVLHAHRRVLRSALSAGGGVELFTEGDSFFFAFADATAALAACVAAQHGLARHHWPDPQARPLVRMGLHSGWARPHGGEYASPEVHRAARIAAAAHGGQILCSAATAEYIEPAPDRPNLRDLGLFQLRGFDGRERLFQVVAPGLPESFPRPRTAQPAPHNLPAQFTSFVGRAPEQARLAELLAGHRLVTVVGAGGAGKTRLAIEVAAARVESYPDGVWFVDLATVTDPGLVTVAVAGALGLRPEPGRPVVQTIAEHLTGRELLLLLDTCDTQVTAVEALVAAVLAADATPRVLATSREPLGLPGELVWRIPPLSLDPTPGSDAGDAVELLSQRIAAARGGSPVADYELPHLARIATRLDGLPLALELAAARLGTISSEQLADRLDAELSNGGGGLLDTIDRPTAAGVHAYRPPVRAGDQQPVQLEEPMLAVTSRHGTLQATVGWSYRTLETDQARLLRWLSVFASPVDVDTAEWLFPGALPALTALVDKSLLHPVDPAVTSPPTGPVAGQGLAVSAPVVPTASNRRSADQRRLPYAYRMLDPIRAYAVRALVAAGEQQAARDRQVQWVLAAQRRAGQAADGAPTSLSLFRLDPLADELRAALQWCVTGGTVGRGLELVAGMDQWWRERGLSREARLWLFRLYGRMAETGEQVAARVLAEAYHVHALQAGADGEHAEQLRYTRLAEEQAESIDDPGLLARVRATRAWAMIDIGDRAGAERLCRELIDWTCQRGVATDSLFAIYGLAQLLWQRGALDEAAELLGAARAAEAARPEVAGRRGVDHLLGMVALARGDLVAAHDHLVVALRSRMSHGFHGRAGETLAAMAVRCAAGGDPGTAVRLFGAVAALRSRLPAPQGGFTSYWTQQQTGLRAILGDSSFDAAFLEGSRLDLQQAAALALAVDQEIPAEPGDLSGQPDNFPQPVPAAARQRRQPGVGESERATVDPRAYRGGAPG